MVKDLNDPTNRDSIPAMLTPGEFVLNKEATAMYGPLIEKMNNAGLQQRHAENQQMLNMGGVARFNTGGIVDFIKQEEGFRNKAYKDPVGIWTIGYGRTTNPDGSPVKPGQSTSRDAENEWIVQRVGKERAAVKQYAKKHGYEWDEGQVDALASFRYNGGAGMLDRLTGGGKRDNETIGGKILQYNKGRVNGELQELGGLTKRRQAEAGMFTGGKAPARQAPADAPVRQVQKQRQLQQQQPSPVPETNAPPVAGEKPGAFEGVGGDLLQYAIAQSGRQGPPVQHAGGRRVEQAAYIPSSAQQRGPISSNMRKKPQQPYNTGGVVHLNEGGFWDGLLNWQGISGDGATLGQKIGVQPGVWWDEEEKKKRAAALQARPGIRPGQPMPQIVPAMQAPPPGSDEAILQGSSDATQDQPPPQQLPLPSCIGGYVWWWSVGDVRP